MCLGIGSGMVAFATRRLSTTPPQETRREGKGDQRKEVATVGGASFHAEWEVFGGVGAGGEQEHGSISQV